MQGRGTLTYACSHACTCYGCVGHIGEVGYNTYLRTKLCVMHTMHCIVAHSCLHALGSVAVDSAFWPSALLALDTASITYPSLMLQALSIFFYRLLSEANTW